MTLVPHERAADGYSRRRRVRRAGLTAFAIPGTLAYVALVMVPLILSLYFSFTDRNLLRPDSEWVGIDNYVRVLTDPTFLGTFAFTAALTAVTVVAVNAIGLALALLLNRVGRLFFAMRMTIFIPAALSGVVIAFIWSTILTDSGLLNATLKNIGLGFLAQSWLGDPTLARGSVIIVAIWQGVALSTVVYLAGLQSVPHHLVEAARIDGANSVRVFRHVTWPLLAPALTVNCTLLLINGFKTYDVPIVMTGTGPAGSTATVATEIIRVGFNLNRVGIASAMAVVMLVSVAVVTAIVVWILQRREIQA